MKLIRSRRQKYITKQTEVRVTKKDRSTDQKDKRQTLCEEYFTKAAEDTSTLAFCFLHLAELINLCWNWQKFIRLLTHEEAVPICFSSYAHSLCFPVLHINSGCSSERWWDVSCDDKLCWKSYNSIELPPFVGVTCGEHIQYLTGKERSNKICNNYMHK